MHWQAGTKELQSSSAPIIIRDSLQVNWEANKLSHVQFFCWMFAYTNDEGGQLVLHSHFTPKIIVSKYLRCGLQ